MATDERDPRRLGLNGPGADTGDAVEVDAALRRLLEPDLLAVERLVRTALAEGEAPSASRGRRWWPQLAVATAFVLLVVFLIPGPSPPPPDGPPSPPAASAETARISITNDDGYVTISSTSGSKWILYSGDDS